ncbi:ricin-type beta-trefoil lectin domain protein [Thermopolyspora sp. NPDC052614]|uniref:ricin-type beta-trefoil lectin domain protein n=1 Tax=Thermopolyspora sp. NPDC052614 TaxID=3155682 RepID=UPI00344945E2
MRTVAPLPAVTQTVTVPQPTTTVTATAAAPTVTPEKPEKKERTLGATPVRRVIAPTVTATVTVSAPTPTVTVPAPPTTTVTAAGPTTTVTAPAPAPTAGVPSAGPTSPLPGRPTSGQDKTGESHVTPSPGNPRSERTDEPRPPAGATGHAAGQGSAAAQDATGVQIVDAAGRCVGATQASEGASLTLQDCTGAATQRWEFRSDGTIRSIGLCMEAATGATASGDTLRLVRCDNAPAQRFTYKAGVLASSAVSKCVDVTRTDAVGAHLRLTRCVTAQKWHKQ